MPNMINANARSHVDAVERIHGAVEDFIAFIRNVQSNIGTDYSAALKIPARVRTLVRQKQNFDAIGIAPLRVKAILEKDQGYDVWTTAHTSDFEAIFTNAEALRTAVENNVGQFPASYDANGNLVFVTASAPVQTALNEAIDAILESVA